MLDMKNIVCAMGSCLSRLDLCVAEKRFADMPYLLGVLTAYKELLVETVEEKLQESKEVTNVVEM